MISKLMHYPQLSITGRQGLLSKTRLIDLLFPVSLLYFNQKQCCIAKYTRKVYQDMTFKLNCLKTHLNANYIKFNGEKINQ
jgi:hypothetical protein